MSELTQGSAVAGVGKRAAFRWNIHPLWILPGLGLAALVFFDLGPPLAFVDDWIYGWVARNFWQYGLQPAPTQSATAIVHEVWGTVFALGSGDQRWLRLSEVPFVLLGSYSTYRLARKLGATQAWAIVAVATILTSPLFLFQATGFETDIPYVALVLAAANTAVSWVSTGRGRWLAILWVSLAGLERQVGVTIPVAITLGVLVGRCMALTREDWLAMALLWVGGVVPTLVLPLVGFQLQVQQHISISAVLDPAHVMQVSGLSVLSAGLLLSPFLFALMLARGSPSKRNLVVGLIGVGLGVAGLVQAATQVQNGGPILPCCVPAASGLGSTSIAGSKPQLFASALFVGISVVTIATVIVGCFRRPGRWTSSSDASPALVVGLIALSQLLPLFLVGDLYDRYFMPMTALLSPLVAARVSVGLKRSAKRSVALAWAVGLCAQGLAMYGVGEQDYQAWQEARDKAAQMAYEIAPPDQVNAGYEANATYWILPSADPAAPLTDLYLPVRGPSNPRVVLEYAGPDDIRPGVGYVSLAPGRIVIVRVR